MAATFDHEVQSSRQNTVESHLPPSTTPGPDSTTTVKGQGSNGTLPNPSPMPIPTSSRSVQETSNTVESHFQPSRDSATTTLPCPSPTSIPTSPRSVQFQETGNTVESHSPDPVKMTSPTSPRSIHFQETSNTVESDPNLTRTVKRQASIVIVSNPPMPTTPRGKERIHFHETELRTTSVTRGPCPLDTHPGARTEVCSWQGPDRAKLVKDGYQTLAIICTFVAGVQASLLQMTYTQTDKSSQIITALFFSGLFADIGAAILSASSARWFEMLTPEEADHVYDWLFVSKGKGLSEEEAQVPSLDEHDKSYFVEKWLYLGLKSGLYAAIVGLGLLAAGVMFYVWAHTPIIVQVMGTVSFTCMAILIPPFFLPHDRVKTLNYIRLHRYSGRDIGHIVVCK